MSLIFKGNGGMGLSNRGYNLDDFTQAKKLPIQHRSCAQDWDVWQSLLSAGLCGGGESDISVQPINRWNSHCSDTLQHCVWYLERAAV